MCLWRLAETRATYVLVHDSILTFKYGISLLSYKKVYISGLVAEKINWQGMPLSHLFTYDNMYTLHKTNFILQITSHECTY